jgi:hypothetical protein
MLHEDWGSEDRGSGLEVGQVGLGAGPGTSCAYDASRGQAQPAFRDSWNRVHDATSANVVQAAEGGGKRLV